MASLFFGGSFNPIHVGHLICARAVAQARGFDRVILVPSAQPPHKPDQSQLASPDDRLAMVQLAIADEPLFAVDALELERPGPSYTIDTVRELQRRGHRQVHWLIGADMLAVLPKWHQPEQLVAEADLVIMSRPGWQFDWMSLPESYRRLRQNVVVAPLLEISASTIRQRVREGHSIRWLTPPAVADYIGRRGLYLP